MTVAAERHVHSVDARVEYIVALYNAVKNGEASAVSDCPLFRVIQDDSKLGWGNALHIRAVPVQPCHCLTRSLNVQGVNLSQTMPRLVENNAERCLATPP